MNQVTHFDFKSSSVRIAFDANNEQLFCFPDVCKALDIKNAHPRRFSLNPKGIISYILNFPVKFFHHQNLNPISLTQSPYQLLHSSHTLIDSLTHRLITALPHTNPL